MSPLAIFLIVPVGLAMIIGARGIFDRAKTDLDERRQLLRRAANTGQDAGAAYVAGV